MNRLDRRIRIYYIDSQATEDGTVRKVKHYLNPDESTKFKAYFRSLSTSEALSDSQLGFITDAMIEINRRRIDEGYFVEIERELFGKETYRIVYYDPFEDRKRSRYRIRAKKVTPESFDEEKWGE